MFLDGGVRLRVEFGEPYGWTEILLRIKFEKEKEKYLRDFIGNPEKITIGELKKFFCEEYEFKADDCLIYRTNAFGDAVKAIKNESITISKAGLKDYDCVYLKNITLETSPNYYIKVFTKKEDPDQYLFQPITDDYFITELMVNIIKYK
jgi:hypothetical protein